jgi:hypothetical protein
MFRVTSLLPSGIYPIIRRMKDRKSGESQSLMELQKKWGRTFARGFSHSREVITDSSTTATATAMRPGYGL